MTSNSNPNASAHIPPDIFDMERFDRSQAPPREAGDPPKDAPAAKPALSKIIKAARPVHFGLAAVVAAMTWIGWPHVFPDNATIARPASRLMLPATAESSPPLTSQVPAPDASAALRREAPTAPQTPEAGPSGLPPFAQPELAAPPVTAVRPSRPARRIRAAIQRPQATAPTTGPASARFSLNTVYAGQAWIQDAERTYVVQAGDTVKGITIVSIDARERRVVTSQGVIR